MQAKLEDPIALTREILHGFYRGEGKPWLSLLSAKTVWMNAGERVLIGGGAIREHFRVQNQRKTSRIFQEEYYPLPINTRSAAVMARLTLGDCGSEVPSILSSSTLVYQLIGSETKLVLVHFGDGFLRPPRREGAEEEVVWVPAYHLYRNLLRETPQQDRLAIPSGGRTFYIHPSIILYVQSRDRRAELVCVDAVIRSDLSIAQVNAMLPEEFCPIHRCYTVNARHVSAIRRYQVTMVTGETLPVPQGSYNQVKAELDRKITGGA